MTAEEGEEKAKEHNALSAPWTRGRQATRLVGLLVAGSWVVRGCWGQQPGWCRVVVGGLVCAACPPRIVRALGLTAGVLEVAVEVLLERVRVAYDPARLGAQDIARKLRKLG